jgi:gliding motility-associated-like protein
MRLCWYWLRIVAVLIYICSSVDKAEAKELIIIGGESGGSWQEGGNGIDPVIILGSQEVTSENVPGGVIDFAFRSGWIFPESADQTENIALQLQDRGGSVTAPTVLGDLGSNLAKMIDNGPNTAFERKSSAGQAVRALGVVLQFDLGARFGVSRIRFFPRNADPDFPAPDFPFQDDFLRAYEIFLNDGTRETLAAGLPVFTSILLRPQNDQPVVDIQIEPQYVRYIQLKSQTTVGFEVGEFQVFGEGFVPTAEYHSDILDLGEDLALWGNLRWEEESRGDPIRSRVSISTRSGFDDSPVVFNRLRTDLDGAEVPWKTADEFDAGSEAQEIVSQFDIADLDIKRARLFYNELPLEVRDEISLTQSDYNKLRAGDKGSVRDDLINWSAWSPPYSTAAITSTEAVAAGDGGVRIVSPGPRRYFQFKAEYSSEELFSAKGLGALSFDFSRPVLAEEIVAEISPRQAELGQNTEFSLVLVPDMRPGVDLGFNSLEIATPVKVAVVNKITISRPDGSRLEQDFSDADLNNLPVERGDFRIDLIEEDRFQFSFPKVESSRIETGQMTVVGVDFQSVVLRTGTAFSIQALAASSDDVSQRVVGGNVFDLTREGADLSLIRNPDNLVVQVEKKGDLLINVRAVPQIFTPNGDRINDTMQIHFDVTDLTSGATVKMRIYDLSGRMVREVYAGSNKSGRYVRAWDGTDSQGSTVPPGLYIFKVDLEADANSAGVSGTIAVIY